MLEITPTLHIDDSELRFDFVRSSGPGGQNVNKVATAAQLRFDIFASTLPIDVRARLMRLARNRITHDGVLIIEAKRFRTQGQNKDDATRRFVDLLRRAATPPKPRRKTRPTVSSKLKRLESKKRRGQAKKLRQSPLD